MKRSFLLFTGLLIAQSLFSQASSLSAPADSQQLQVLNLLDAFQKGHFSGHFRSFFMATDNTRQLSDYYALAAGGGLRFNTADWHGFSLGIGGVFNFNLASSDLSAKDPATGASNRYEIGLFDVENPKNRNDLDRMEEFWVRYTWKGSSITLGKQLLQTPFVNHQDGRMRPTAEDGIWVSSRLLKNTRLEGGWLWKISPRSTVHWYNIGTSIGLYPKGLNPDGTGSGYPENLESKGIGLLGISHQWGKNTRIQVWDQYVDHIFNTAFVQADHTLPLKNGQKLLFGLQLIHQNAVDNGGHAEAAKTYFQKGAQSNALSAQSGWQRGPWQALVAYTRISDDGRFLSPREWGREPFYTFMSRERIEGSGGSHSITGRLNWQNQDKKLRVEAAYGHFYLPDIKNASLNKYAFPSFQQFNFDVRYALGGVFKGFQAQFLYVWKGRLGAVYGADKYVINRVDMSQYNLVINYRY